MTWRRIDGEGEASLTHSGDRKGKIHDEQAEPSPGLWFRAGGPLCLQTQLPRHNARRCSPSGAIVVPEPWFCMASDSSEIVAVSDASSEYHYGRLVVAHSLSPSVPSACCVTVILARTLEYNSITCHSSLTLSGSKHHYKHELLLVQRDFYTVHNASACSVWDLGRVTDQSRTQMNK
jgi:hypothetical protein